MSDQETDDVTPKVPAFHVNAGAVTATNFSVHFVAGVELPDGQTVPSFIMTLGTEFAEELGRQLLRAVDESRRARAEPDRPALVADA